MRPSSPPPRSPGRAPLAAVLAAAALPLASGRPTAQQPPVDLVGDIGIGQRLGESLPLDVPVVTAEGRRTALGELFGERPVVLGLVYYECPMLCTLVLEGLLETLRPMRLEVGTDFDVVLLSIDPGETPALAAAQKERLVAAYRRPDSAPGWHVLTAPAATVDAVAEAVGFHYAYDPEKDEYAHAAGVQVATPEGVLSRYFYGVEVPSRDLRLGLVEASEGRIGDLADQVLLWCYRYDPVTGRYGFAILTAIRVLGTATVLVLGTFVLRHLRRERRAARQSRRSPNRREASSTL